jgi:hypothetical protein
MSCEHMLERLHGKLRYLVTRNHAGAGSLVKADTDFISYLEK